MMLQQLVDARATAADVAYDCPGQVQALVIQQAAS